MNVLPSLAQEGLRQVELMTSVPLCRASKKLGIVLIAKRSGSHRVLLLHIYVSLILVVAFQNGGISLLVKLIDTKQK